MSETERSEAPPAPPGDSGLYDEAGRPLRSGQSEKRTEDLVRLAQDHPVATALGALALGYIIGKLF